MCGRGYMDESKGDLKPVDNTFLLTPALKWEIASNPFNKYSSVRNDISVQQISPKKLINTAKEGNVPSETVNSFRKRNAPSLEAKLKVIQENKLAGVAEWSLGKEESSVWKLISQYVN